MKRVALITGGASGIGFGISGAMAQEGFDLVLCGRRPAEKVRAALAALQDQGADVCYVSADIGRPEDREAVVVAARSRFGRLDMLVNNAGVAPRMHRGCCSRPCSGSCGFSQSIRCRARAARQVSTRARCGFCWER
jgi:NAD(P)-dependent dehydrogenase (short-subunit alcohol dehydrogenase family)